MRALHVIPAVAPRYGGPSAAVLPMCAALARRPGVSVEIVSTDADGATGRLSAADLPAGDVPVRLFRRDWSERWKYSRGLAAWLARHAGDYDVLHVHAVWSHATAAACRAASRWLARLLGYRRAHRVATPLRRLVRRLSRQAASG